MRARVRSAVTRVISNAQSANGHSSTSISGSTRPMKDLQGFDSMMAACATLDLSVELECDIKENIYLFRSRDGEERTVDEIVDQLCNIMQEQGVIEP